MKKLFLTVALFMVSALSLIGCGEKGKTYTYLVNEEDTASYTRQGGYFTPNIDEETNFTATTKVSLTINGNEYKLHKLVENTKEGAACLKTRAEAKGWEFKPIKFEYTFKGQVEKGEEEGIYVLKAAAWGEGYQDWGTFDAAGVESSIDKATSDEDESILDYFKTPYVRESENADEEIRLNEDGSFEYLEIEISW